MTSIADSASEVSGGVTSGAVARVQETAKPLTGGAKKRRSKTSKRSSRKSKSMKNRKSKGRKTSKK